MADRQRSPWAKGRILIDMAVTAFRGGEVEAVRQLLPDVLSAASALGDVYYLATATALRAWVAWRAERWGEALASEPGR